MLTITEHNYIRLLALDKLIEMGPDKHRRKLREARDRVAEELIREEIREWSENGW